MEAGKLRHLITIEAPTEAQDKYGEPVQGWTQVAEVWASREDLSGREWFAAQQVQADVTTRFRIRYRDGIRATMRVTSDGVTYNILSAADPDGKSRTLVLLAAREG